VWERAPECNVTIWAEEKWEGWKHVFYKVPVVKHITYFLVILSFFHGFLFINLSASEENRYLPEILSVLIHVLNI
jgi:hypothetical protein